MASDSSKARPVAELWAELDARCLSLLTPAAVTLAWLLLHVTYAFEKRHLLSASGIGFNYVAFSSLWQQGVTLLLLAPLIFLNVAHASIDEFRRNFVGLTALGVMSFITQLCLSSVQDFLGNPLIEMVKCGLPFSTLLFSVLLERDHRGAPMTYSLRACASLVIIVLGASLAVYTDSQSSALGYFLVFVAILMVSVECVQSTFTILSA